MAHNKSVTTKFMERVTEVEIQIDQNDKPVCVEFFWRGHLVEPGFWLDDLKEIKGGDNKDELEKTIDESFPNLKSITCRQYYFDEE